MNSDTGRRRWRPSRNTRFDSTMPAGGLGAAMLPRSAAAVGRVFDRHSGPLPAHSPPRHNPCTRPERDQERGCPRTDLGARRQQADAHRRPHQRQRPHEHELAHHQPVAVVPHHHAAERTRDEADAESGKGGVARRASTETCGRNCGPRPWRPPFHRGRSRTSMVVPNGAAASATHRRVGAAADR